MREHRVYGHVVEFDIDAFRLLKEIKRIEEKRLSDLIRIETEKQGSESER